MIKGNKISLIPATLDDRQKVYDWCFHSETTKSHAGSPDYPDISIPSYKEFYEDYRDYYFTGGDPLGGRQYFIAVDGKRIGCISYSAFHLKPGVAELDNWMSCEAHCGKGYGTDAIIALSNYLHEELGFHTMIMGPSVKNARAIRAYEKAGLVGTDHTMRDFLLPQYISEYGEGDYGLGQTVVCVKRFNRKDWLYNMENKPITMMDILIETHAGLERQGFGSPEITLRALSFVDNLSENSKVADLGCGTGGGTMVLAQNAPGSIVGVDQIPDFISIFNDKVKKLTLSERVTGIVGDITNLPFAEEEFDLIWSEGVIDSIGFENGLVYWNSFLKKDGYVAVTCPSWLAGERPAEVDAFWTDAGSKLDAVEDNIAVMQKCGYSFVAAFTLPEECWTDHYFAPRGAAEKAFAEKYPGNKTIEEYLVSSNLEVNLYEKYKQYYGYVFYIGRKA